jgi:transglutaminase-like putative cysteine protease
LLKPGYLIRLAKLTLLISLCLCSSSFPLPGWLKDAIKSVEGIQVHEDANRVYLLDEQVTEISEEGKAKTEGRYALKILKTSAIANANFALSTRDKERVKGLKGWCIEPNGTVTKLKKDNIYEVAASNRPGWYDDIKVVAAVFPTVEIGDIVAYEWEFEDTDTITAFHQYFVFQHLAPVLSARFELRLPDGWQIHTSEQYTEPVSRTDQGNSIIWSTGFLPYRQPEPYMPPESRVSRRIIVACYHPTNSEAAHLRDWNTASRWAWDLMETAARPTDTIQQLVKALIAETQTVSDKAEVLAHYVRDEIRYVAIEIGEGGLRPRPAESVLLNRYGDCKDKTTLLRAMLKEVGIQSRPVLATLGREVDTGLSSPFQFNHCIAAISLDGFSANEYEPQAEVNGWLLFDATNEWVDFGRLPPSLYGSPVLPAAPDSLSIFTLPDFDPNSERKEYTAIASVSADNELSADIAIHSYEALGLEMAEYISRSPQEDQIADLRGQFAHCVQAPAISNYRAAPGENSVGISFTLTGSHYLSDAGDMRLLKANCFREDLPGMRESETRRFPVWLGRSMSFETSITWLIPEGWKVLDDPDTLYDSCSLGDLHCRTAVNDTSFTINIHARYFGTMLSPDKYEDAKEFLDFRRKIYGMRILLTDN